jgi:hypothetical protein
MQDPKLQKKNSARVKKHFPANFLVQIAKNKERASTSFSGNNTLQDSDTSFPQKK